MRDHEKSNAYIKQKFKGKIVDIAIFLDGKKTRKLLVLEFPTKLKSLHMLSISQLCGCQKGGNTYRYGSRCGSVETCRNVRGAMRSAGEGVLAEALPLRPVYMATVTLKNVKKIYDNKVTAVHDFNLEIADKEFIVLVGPSGCGKSTTPGWRRSARGTS